MERNGNLEKEKKKEKKKKRPMKRKIKEKQKKPGRISQSLLWSSDKYK